MHIALFSFTSVKIISLTTLTTLFYFATFIKMKPLFTLTMLFYFTTIKIKSLTILTILFSFTAMKKVPDYAYFPVLLHYYSNEIFDNTHCAVLLCHSY